METPKPAAFKLTDITFVDYTFRQPIPKAKEKEEAKEINVTTGFNPTGKYYKEQGLFQLTLNIVCSPEDDKGNDFIKITLVADFIFEDKPNFEDIPDYFYQNSIAIIFPYVRAFISTLTLHSNSGLIILGLLNLSGLGTPFKKASISV